MVTTRTVSALVICMILITLFAWPTVVFSQTQEELQSRFGQALIQVQRAESAGATTSEVAPLVALLNQAIGLDDQALKLTKPADAQRRLQLLNQTNLILYSVLIQASQLEQNASQRTLTNKIATYVASGVAALLATLAYSYLLTFWRKYRVRRTFQMKVIRK